VPQCFAGGLSFGRLAPPRFCCYDVPPRFCCYDVPPRFCFGDSTTFTETEPRDNTNRSRAAKAAESEGGIIRLSFGRLAPPRFCCYDVPPRFCCYDVPPRFCFGDSTTFTETEPRYNTNRSRAAQAAESKGGIVKLSFGRLAPPRFCCYDVPPRFCCYDVPPRFCCYDVPLPLCFCQKSCYNAKKVDLPQNLEQLQGQGPQYSGSEAGPYYPLFGGTDGGDLLHSKCRHRYPKC